MTKPLLDRGWERQLGNISRARMVFINDGKNLHALREVNPVAFVNVINSECVWGAGSGGSKNSKYACLKQFASLTRCDIASFVSPSFGNSLAPVSEKEGRDESLAMQEITLFIHSTAPWSVFLVNTTSAAEIVGRVDRALHFALQAIQSSLKGDVYRGLNSFQALQVHISKLNGLIYDILPNPKLHPDVWTSMLLGTGNGGALLTPLAMRAERFECSTPNLFAEQFHAPASCNAPSLVRFGSRLACSSLQTITRINWSSGKDRCGLSQVANLPVRHALEMTLGGNSAADVLKCSSTSSGQTWQEADKFCRQAGARLCTLQEITEESLPTNTGCGGDFQRTWTATRCSNYPLAFWVALGTNKYGAKVPPICHPVVLGNGHRTLGVFKPIVARCCADEQNAGPVCLDELDAKLYLAGDPFLPCTATTSNPPVERSALSCAELWFKYPSKPQVSNKLQQGNNFQHCHQRMACKQREYATYCDAKSYCHRMGARLCTKTESQTLGMKCDIWLEGEGKEDCSAQTRQRRFCCADEVGQYCNLLNVLPRGG